MGLLNTTLKIHLRGMSQIINETPGQFRLRQKREKRKYNIVNITSVHPPCFFGAEPVKGNLKEG